MGRPANYEMCDVLRKSAALFRKRGYERTSVEDLVKSTGINRFAIYEKFGGKEGLFHAALDFYVDVAVKQELLASLSGDDVTLEALLLVLERMRAVNLDLAQPAGCLIINASIEMAGRDPRVELAVERFSEAFREATSHVLHRARASGEMGSERPVAELAEQLVTSVNVFMVAAHLSRESADKVILHLLETVRLWRSPRPSARTAESCDNP